MAQFKVTATVSVDIEMLITAETAEAASRMLEDQLAVNAILTESKEGEDYLVNEDSITEMGEINVYKA